MGVGNADQSWYGVSKRRMDRKSQSLGPRLKFQLPPRAAVIQCWCSNPVESSSWCYDPWSSGRAYGLVAGDGI